MNRLLHLFLFLLLAVSYGCGSDIIEDNEPIEPTVIPVETVSAGKYPIIAHRGSWYHNGHPQNSLAALREALALDLYGSECDVWKSKDGEFVINHDKTFNGLDITQSTYEELTKYPLANGECISTLDDFLIEVENSTTNTKLVIDIKSNVKALELFNAVSRRGLIHKVLFITYSYSKCQDFTYMGCGDIAFFIGGTRTPEELKKEGIGGVVSKETDVREVPGLVERAKEAGVRLVLGSVTNPTIMAQYLDKDCLFSSNKPVTLMQAIDEMEESSPKGD